jgi:hypothetical protein
MHNCKICTTDRLSGTKTGQGNKKGVTVYRSTKFFVKGVAPSGFA